MITGYNIIIKEGFQESTYNRLLKRFTDPIVMRYVGFAEKSLKIKNEYECKSFVSKLKDGMFFEIYRKENMEFIGYAVLSDFSKTKCEFGIFIGEKEYRNKGVGLEANKLILQYGFNELKMDEIFSSTCEYNIGMRKINEKLGAKITKIKKNGRTVLIDGKWQKANTICYSVYKSYFNSLYL